MVIVVENEAITAFELKMLLKRQGYNNALCFSEGRKAVQFIRKEEPEFAILDIRLADDVSGLEIAKILKVKNIPFIFISAFSDPAFFENAKALNPAGLITKPFDESELINILDSLILKTND
jgi:DNA-binding NarL/FixJ family response regulator